MAVNLQIIKEKVNQSKDRNALRATDDRTHRRKRLSLALDELKLVKAKLVSQSLKE